MGMYDIVEVKCPHCHRDTQLQSKSGECTLNIYTLNNAPSDVMEDLLGERGWRRCINCGKEIVVALAHKGLTVKAKP